MIEVKNVTKQFGAVKALENINLTFEEEKIYGLLGRNGAGKTTLLNLITNRIFPTSGEVLIDGETAVENDSAQEKIYFMSEQNLYPENSTVLGVFKNAQLFYPGFDHKYAIELCKKFALDPKKKVSQLSTGYTSIYKLITALSVQVKYVFLDEPVLGLDANHRELFYQILLENYARNPRTIVISTHLIEEVSSVLEEVVIIKNGTVIRKQTMEEIMESGYSVSGTAAAVDAYIKGKKVLGSETLGGLKTASILGRPKANELPQGIEVSKMDLQKLFIQLTND